MKKLNLLLLLTSLSLVDCTRQNISSTVPTSSQTSEETSSSSVVETLKSISLNYENYTLSITSEVANPTVTLTVTTNPVSFASETVTWSSADETVATVNNGVVTAVSVGTVRITATVLNKSASCLITVEKTVFDNVIDMDVKDLGTTELNQNLYRIKGVVENINSVSNNFNVVDTTGTGKYVTVNRIGYEASKKDDFTVTDDEITYNSPDVFANLDIAEGKYVTIVGIYYHYANTYYFDGYLDDITDGTEINYSASVSVNDSTMGSATLSKSENIKWGEKVTITATPNDGYAIGTITKNEIVVNVDDNGAYTFTTSAYNSIKVTFIKKTSTIKTLDFTNLGTASITSPSSEEYITLKNTGSNNPKWNYSTTASNVCLILYGNNNGSTDGNSLDTIKDFGDKITKVVVNAYGQKAGTYFAVYGSNDNYDATGATTRTWTKIGNDVTMSGNGPSSLAEYTIDVSSSYKYIRIQCAGSSATIKQTKITSVSYYIG